MYFPQEILGKGWHESVVLVHEDAMKLCRLLTWELGEAKVRKELRGISDHLVQAECQRDWLESVLVRNQPECERYGSLRALSAEFPLNPECEGSGDQFLQTRTVGLSEARRELNLWKPPAAEEVNSLEVASQAVVRIKSQEVEGWIKEGVPVLQLPGKCVLTRKSGTGKRKVRAVGCGNYLPSEHLQLTREDVYASGADALTLRVALAFAAAHRDWKGFTVDIKTAFLHAPIGAEREGRPDRIIIKPRHFSLSLGFWSPPIGGGSRRPCTVCLLRHGTGLSTGTVS